VDPGERLRLGRVEVTGLDPEMRDRVAPLVEGHTGDTIRADDIATSIVAIESELRRRGHAQATVTAKLAPPSPAEPFVRDLTLDVATGPTFELHEVRFEGAITSDEDWLAKTAGLTAEKPLDPQEISKARGRLSRTGVFEGIEVTTDPPTTRTAPVAEPEPGRSIPATVEFSVAERKRWQLAYGGRYETSNGLGVVLDLYNFNTFGRGQTTGFRGLYSAEDSRLQAYHSVPRVIGERSSLEGFVEWKKELEEGVWSEGETAWLQLTFPPAGRWQNRAYVQWEDLDLTAEEPDPANPLDERSLSPAFGYQLVWDSRVLTSAVVRRQRGFFYGLNLLTSTDELGSDFTGLASYQQWSFFWPFGDPKAGRVSWYHSYRFDTANVVDDDVPFDDRLRAGGEFSVRGYPTNSLGARDAAGNAIGGEVLFIANEELHVLWGRGVSSIVFFDAGEVWPTLGDVGGRLSSSYGIGLRWASPAGPLRLDWATPLDRRAGDPHSIVYVGFGNVF
jgi:translocation and assembly module TamA